MALRATPTIAICLTAGIAAGVALARPGDQPAPAAAPSAAPAVVATVPAPTEPQVGDSDSPYLADGEQSVVGSDVAAAPTTASATAPAALSIEGFAFSPSAPVAAGTTVSVTNLDSASHTLTARDDSFDTGTLGQDQQASFAAPAAPGTYEFFCVIHPSMTGELVVS